jgi:hypothetical protein
MKRKGLGKGLGQGYFNIAPLDSHIHSLSAKGIKTYTKPVAVTIQKSIKSLGAYGDMRPVEVIKKGKKRGEIYYDETPESPREWDNMGTMVCFHGRYTLGDKTELSSDQFEGWDELEKYLVKKKKAVIIMPLYLYDHSGLRMKVGSFQGLLPQGHAEFDSGQVGFIYATEKQIKDMFGVKSVSNKTLKRAEEILRGEVETYDQYLMGDVYGYKVVEEIPVTKTYPDGHKVTVTEDKEIDSCWGYYGMDAVTDEVNSILGVKKK